MKGIEVSWDTALLAGFWAQRSETAASVSPPDRNARPPEPRHTLHPRVPAWPGLRSRTLPIPACPAPRPAPESRTLFPGGPGAPLHAGSCGLGGDGEGPRLGHSAWQEAEAACGPPSAPPRAAPRRAAAAVLALTCLSAEVQRSGAGWAADSLTSLGVERSRRGTRSPSSRRHGEWVPQGSPGKAGKDQNAPSPHRSRRAASPQARPAPLDRGRRPGPSWGAREPPCAVCSSSPCSCSRWAEGFPKGAGKVFYVP